MTVNANITLYHYDENHDTYTVSRYSAHLHSKLATAVSGNGFVYDNVHKIRIPTADAVSAAPGDYIRTGEYYDTRPDKELCMKVIAVADNRTGTQPHWRIDAV